MMNELVNLNELTKLFVTKCFKLGVIDYDYNLISFDNTHIFKFEKDLVMNQKSLQVIYSDIIEEYAASNNIDFTFSLSKTIVMSFNTIFSFSKNRPLFYLSKNDVRKKQISGLNDLLKRVDIVKTDSVSNLEVNILFPFIFDIDDSIVVSILNWIKILSNLMKINRVFILSIFNLEEEITRKEEINALSSKLDINVITRHLVDNIKFFDILKESNIIDNNVYNQIKMFILPSQNQFNDINSKMIQNTLFLEWKNLTKMKKSRLCVSLETITEMEELIKYANVLGSYICAVKINTNFIFSEALLSGLKKLANHHKFIIIDDKQLIIKRIEELKMINVFKYVDVVSLKLEIMSEEIEPWFKKQRDINPRASFIINYEGLFNEEQEIARKQYEYFNKYVFGLIGVKELINNYVCLINYSEINRLNDDFKTLKLTDIVILEEELYNSKNPIDVVKKINTIMNT